MDESDSRRRGRGMAIDFMWIPPDLGGHRSDPYPGMRLQICWQEHVRVYLQGGMDVECQLLGYDSSTSRGKALCTFSPGVAVPAEWLEGGKLFELRNGFRLLAVGRITPDDR